MQKGNIELEEKIGQDIKKMHTADTNKKKKMIKMKEEMESERRKEMGDDEEEWSIKSW